MIDAQGIVDRITELESALSAARAEVERLRLAMKMAHDAMVFDPRDWALDRTDAWLWALLVGWDEESQEEIIQKHGSGMHGACTLGRAILSGLGPDGREVKP